MNTNKFGVPYHAYVLTLDNGCVVQFDMAWEECWGDVSLWNAAWNHGQRNEDGDPYGYQNGGAEEQYVGFGNEVDGFRKIIQVYDEDEGCYISPFEFYRRTDKYVDNYSS